MPTREKSSHRLTGLLILIWLLYGISIATGFFETKRQHQVYIENHLSSILTSSQLFFRQVDNGLSELAETLAQLDENTDVNSLVLPDANTTGLSIDLQAALADVREALPNVVMLAALDTEGRRISSTGLTPEREKMLAMANRDFIREHENGLAYARFYAPEPKAGNAPPYSLVSYRISVSSQPVILVAILEMAEISRWLEHFSQSTGLLLRLTGANDALISQHPLEQPTGPLNRAFVNAQKTDPDYRLTIEASLPWANVLPSMLISLLLSFVVLVLISVGLIWILRKYHQETYRRKALLDEVRTVLQLVEHGVCVTDEKGRVLYANSHLLEITGWEASSLEGKNLHTALHQPPADKALDALPSDTHNMQDCPILTAITAGEEAEFRDTTLYQRNGKTIFVVLRVKPIVLVNKRQGAVISIDDVTQSRQREARLRYEAFHDNLTGLNNRSRLNEAMEERLLATPTKQQVDTTLDALLFIDLDGFKPINDTYGHEAGDMLLIEVAKRLSKQAREEDLVVRQGGDEFVILMTNLPDEEVVKRRAHQLLGALTAPIELEDTPPITVGASIGIAIKQKGRTTEEWLQNADNAMYQAKENGKNRVVCAHQHT
ncbi:sensor domain-containing diguanylate cyclase [Halomonas vilamensis]|uniref:Sensor domain-containing diguanylate cyclase n=1 Tax=Vreelandella vilamensis TaxID=531309 RepID=A0ABU1H053_9GAMM|nr:sensor domain-containing diguanylate cyclase [Halomonas vilamensis]MDR5897697.1 sensor domain-containing diguanylate cyclase [Halomonas vilamensis]